MSDRTLVYLAHPLGPRNGEDMVVRQNNIADALAWLRILVERTKWSIEMSWFAYVMALDGDLYRQRTYVDQLETISRCDLIVLTGWMSPHMRDELRHAQRLAIRTLDLTWLGNAREFPREVDDKLTMVLRAVAEG